MKLPALLTADLHLVAEPSCEYRWGLFPWLREVVKEEKVQTVCILGDLVDKKDNHPSELVNRVAHETSELAKLARLLMIPGNHEWLKEGHEFFRFLRMHSNIRYFTEPTEDGGDGGVNAMFLPFTKNPAKAWAELDLTQGFYDYVFMHQTIAGARSSNGETMEGEALPDLKNWPKIYSGDIHVPQVIGAVEYVGSPYHVHFGDNFKPRCVLIEKGGRAIDLHFKTVARRSIKVNSLRALRHEVDDTTSPKDQVKVTMRLREAEKHEWHRIKREALDVLKDAGLEVHGLSLEIERSAERMTAEVAAVKARSPADAVLRFVTREELTAEAYDVAMEVIER
jgi:predicted MPP superfamily phosphohydrolase